MRHPAAALAIRAGYSVGTWSSGTGKGIGFLPGADLGQGLLAQRSGTKSTKTLRIAEARLLEEQPAHRPVLFGPRARPPRAPASGTWSPPARWRAGRRARRRPIKQLKVLHLMMTPALGHLAACRLRLIRGAENGPRPCRPRLGAGLLLEDLAGRDAVVEQLGRVVDHRRGRWAAAGAPPAWLPGDSRSGLLHGRPGAERGGRQKHPRAPRPDNQTRRITMSCEADPQSGLAASCSGPLRVAGYSLDPTRGSDLAGLRSAAGRRALRPGPVAFETRLARGQAEGGVPGQLIELTASDGLSSVRLRVQSRLPSSDGPSWAGG